MDCLICSKVETYPGSEDVQGICGKCIQLLLSSSQEEISRAYYSAIENKQMEKAEILGSYLTKKKPSGISKAVRHKEGLSKE